MFSSMLDKNISLCRKYTYEVNPVLDFSLTSKNDDAMLNPLCHKI